jgi:Arc/MetJ-type ribon-helix-helix transcriptional regulator
MLPAERKIFSSNDEFIRETLAELLVEEGYREVTLELLAAIAVAGVESQDASVWQDGPE